MDENFHPITICEDGLQEMECLTCGEVFIVDWLAGINVIFIDDIDKTICPSCNTVENL